jgi:hypothetical protein
VVPLFELPKTTWPVLPARSGFPSFISILFKLSVRARCCFYHSLSHKCNLSLIQAFWDSYL